MKLLRIEICNLSSNAVIFSQLIDMNDQKIVQKYTILFIVCFPPGSAPPNFNNWGAHGVVAVEEKGREKDATEINTAMKTFMVTQRKKIISERKSRIVIAWGAEKAAIYICPGLLLLRVLPG